MKAVIPVALVGALMMSPAFGAGSDRSSTSSMSGTRTQSSMSGQDSQTIMQIQQQLKQQGYNVGTVDGKMGSQTRQALMNFQRDKNLQPNGQIDQQTMAALGVSRSGSSQQAETPASRGSMGTSSGMSGSNTLNNSGGGMGPGSTGITSSPGSVPGGASNIPGGPGTGTMGSGPQQGPSPRSDSLPTPTNR